MSRPRRQPFGAVAVLAVASSAALGAGCHGSKPGGGTTRVDSGTVIDVSSVARPASSAPVVRLDPPPKPAEPTARERLGRSIFFDTALSEPAGTSCASCHDPERAFSGNHGSTTGVALGSRPGHFAKRNTPSVLYMKYVKPLHFALEDEDDSDAAPFAGFGWSGRADTVAGFSRLPLLDPDEMNNGSAAVVAAKLRKAVYADDLVREFPGALDAPDPAMRALAEALEAFLTSDAMSPFTSKFDDFVRGRAQLSPLEMRGLKEFRNPAKGACHFCHVVYETWNRPEGSMFTNYGYDALSPPRNRAIPANADPSRYDLGLCQARDGRRPRDRSQHDRPDGGDHASDPKWCLRFRTPSLRNVAVRERFMHNGVFQTLRQAVAFYSTRTTSPELWYGPGGPFDDAPAQYKGNVNVLSLPYNRRRGDAPVLSDEDIDAIVAFLQTLTDEPYRSGSASASR